MAKVDLHIKAVGLRKKGMSYSQIKEELGVSKSTLSGWLRDIPLSKKQLEELNYKNEKRIERFRSTMRKKKRERERRVLDIEKTQLLPLTRKELYLFGLGLYWGEGLKANYSMVSFTNSNPEMIRFYVEWITRLLRVSRNKLRARLHLYSDMDVDSEIRYWSEKIGLNQDQFTKPYIKKITVRSVVYKGFGHGTCDISVGGVELRLKVMMGIRAVSDSVLEHS